MDGQYAISINGAKPQIIHNMITNAGLALLAQNLVAATDSRILYIAIGTSSTAVSASDTQLSVEVYRQAVTAISRSGGVVTSTFYLSTGEANVAIAEIGIFAGDATAAANSGTLLSRILWSHTKTADEEITITRTDTIARG